jgi:molecular chaperone GrpE
VVMAEPNEIADPDEGIGPAALAAENASLQDRLLRALADAENTRRQCDRATAEARDYAISSFARELLTVEDNLHRAIEAAKSHGADGKVDKALIEGVEATERLLGQIFERFGIRKIDAAGAPFDPQLHEAMTEVDDPFHPPGSVVQVLEDGYTIRNRLLRPARVIVASQPSQTPGALPNDALGAPQR